MTKREQELVDQHRAWRDEIDARAEQPADIAPLLDLAPRDQRLEAAKARREARLSYRGRADVRFITQHGVTLIQGPAAQLEQAWQSGATIRVRGFNGALYPCRLEKVLPADQYGQAIAWPHGTQADHTNLVRLGVADYKPEPNTTRGTKRHGGQRRGKRTRR